LFFFLRDLQAVPVDLESSWLTTRNFLNLEHRSSDTMALRRDEESTDRKGHVEKGRSGCCAAVFFSS